MHYYSVAIDESQLVHNLRAHFMNLRDSVAANLDKCTKHQFIHLLTATFKDLHIENSKNYKR